MAAHRNFTRAPSRRAILAAAAGASLLLGGLAQGAQAQDASGSTTGNASGGQSGGEPIRIGHLTPLTGFLGPLGEYAQRGAQLAAEEINAGGGVMGRPIELVMEDSVNPQTASAKAERLINRDEVALIVGEISSASALAISQVADREDTVFINTGANSDALRGESCNPFMFHVEAGNSMMVQTAGQYLLNNDLVKDKAWFSLTADYAFGHDLRRVAQNFMEKHGGELAGDVLVPTDATDFSPYMLKIRQAQPDLVISNLAGNQITNFMKQYASYGLPFPVAGFGFDTAVAWGAGEGAFSGIWPLVWHHNVDTPSSRAFVEAFEAKYGQPPDNQAWGDYVAMKVAAKAMEETQSTDSQAIAEYLRSGAEFDVLKSRPGRFRPYDNQLVMEMYAVEAKDPDEMANKWDIYTPLGVVPAPDQDLEIIAPPKDGACVMPS